MNIYLMSRRWINERITSKRLLSCIRGSSTKKTLSEAATPVIFYPDEDDLSKRVEKEDSFVDPFEAKVYDAEEKNKSGTSPPVSFEIVGTFRCVPRLDTIIENHQEEASFEPCFQSTKAHASGLAKCSAKMMSSPTSIEVVATSEGTPNLAPVRLFQDDSADSDVFNMSEDEEFETISFAGITFEEVDGLAAKVGDDSNEEKESLEVWVDSLSMKNGFTKAAGYRSHDWNADE